MRAFALRSPKPLLEGPVIMGEGTGCSNTRADLWGTEGSNPLPSSAESAANLLRHRQLVGSGSPRCGLHQLLLPVADHRRMNPKSSSPKAPPSSLAPRSDSPPAILYG